MKTFLNVLVCIVAALFSSVLVFTIAVLPLYFSIVSFTNPKTVVNVVQNIDYTDFLLSAEEWQEVISVDGLDAEKIDAFLKSDVVAEALELYAQDFLNATLNDDTDERVLTGDALRDLADRNMDELMEFVKSYIPGDTDIDAEEVEQHIRTAVDTYADTIVEALPLPEPVPEGEEDPFALLRQVLSPAVTVTLCMVLVFSAAIVYACRYKRFQGLLWLNF